MYKSLSHRLRHRIDIEALTVSQDSTTGAVSQSWATIRAGGEALLAAEIVPASGREFVSSQATQASVATRMTIRHRSGIEPSMRVIHGSDIYNIEAVLPDPTFARHLTLMCTRGVNEG